MLTNEEVAEIRRTFELDDDVKAQTIMRLVADLVAVRDALSGVRSDLACDGWPERRNAIERIGRVLEAGGDTNPPTTRLQQVGWTLGENELVEMMPWDDPAKFSENGSQPVYVIVDAAADGSVPEPTTVTHVGWRYRNVRADGRPFRWHYIGVNSARSTSSTDSTYNGWTTEWQPLFAGRAVSGPVSTEGE